MPTVTLPAKDVANAANTLIGLIQTRRASAEFQGKAEIDPRKPDPRPEQLTAIVDAATWLQNMEVSNATIGLTLEEAKMLEAFLPDYG